MNYTNHLLSEYNILKCFNITKRISQSSLKKMTEKLKNSNKSDKMINDEVYDLILSENKGEIDIENVPGIILKQQKEQSDIKSKNNVQSDFNNLPYDKQKNIIELAATIINASYKFELDSLDIFFLIQIIFNELKISASDMKRYNDKYSNSSQDDFEDEFDDDDFEDEEEDDDDDDFKF